MPSQDKNKMSPHRAGYQMSDSDIKITEDFQRTADEIKKEVHSSLMGSQKIEQRIPSSLVQSIENIKQTINQFIGRE